METSKGKPAKFDCIWCEKKVDGYLIELHIDYNKQKTERQYVCPNCPSRVTRVRTEGCE